MTLELSLEGTVVVVNVGEENPGGKRINEDMEI